MILPRAIGLAHSRVSFQVGDRAVITAVPRALVREGSGWWTWRECLSVGAVVEVMEPPEYWGDRWNVMVRPERAWSVSQAGTKFEKRYFREGEERPWFMFPASMLRVVKGDET